MFQENTSHSDLCFFYFKSFNIFATVDEGRKLCRGTTFERNRLLLYNRVNTPLNLKGHSHAGMAFFVLLQEVLHLPKL